jgi:hypothetical protein
MLPPNERQGNFSICAAATALRLFNRLPDVPVWANSYRAYGAGAFQL